MKTDIIKKIAKKIKHYDNIVIARHVGADPDAVCSQIALRDSIRLTYPQKKVYAVGQSVARFKIFGLMDKVEVNHLKNVLLITTDVPNKNRIDGINSLDYSDVIKIDHHPFEIDFGGLEYIDDTASSACQLVTNLILKSNLRLNDKIAENLFLGIVSDSDRFLLAYTSIETFKIVTSLLERSRIPFPKSYYKLYERPINEFKFHGYLVNNLNIGEEGLAHEIITTEILNEYKVDIATPSNMINEFNYIKNVLVWVFFTFDEKNEIYKINIRSRGPVINEIATHYNGGGHKFASGARIKDKEQIPLLLKELSSACKAYKVEKSNN